MEFSLLIPLVNFKADFLETAKGSFMEIWRNHWWYVSFFSAAPKSTTELSRTEATTTSTTTAPAPKTADIMLPSTNFNSNGYYHNNQWITRDQHHQAIVVEDGSSLPPVRSNVNPDQPLRPKPPSAPRQPIRPNYQDTPRPNYYQHSNNYGVENPQYHSDNKDKTAGSKLVKVYGPDDFMTETVQLDKAYFHQVCQITLEHLWGFFSGKP